MDENDFWGLVIDGTFGNSLYTGAGYQTVKTTSDGYVLDLDSAKSVDLIEKCASLFGNRNKVLNDPAGNLGYSAIFKSGNALFYDYTILGTFSMRDMTDDFGIIPCPKYDINQDAYYTACNTWLPSGVAVPMLVSDKERTGLIMETMARASYDSVAPAIYETTLRGKVARDSESAKMLDLIFEGASFDFNTVFNFADTALLLRNAVVGEQPNFISKYESVKEKAQNELNKVIAFAKE